MAKSHSLKGDPNFRGFDVRDWKAFGLNEAIIIQQISFWSKVSKREPEEGIYRTHEEWLQDIPFSESTFKRSVKKLESLGVVKLYQKSGHRNNHQVWYSLNIEKLESFRSDIPTIIISKKKDKTMPSSHTFSASIEDSNLTRICNVVGSKWPDKIICDDNVVSPKWTVVSSEWTDKPQAYIIYIQRRIQTLILDLKNQENKLDAKSVWKIHRQLTFRKNVTKDYFAQISSKWSQAQRDRFMCRLADHLLHQYLTLDFKCWEKDEPDELRTSGLRRNNRQTDFISVWLQAEAPFEEEDYDKLFIKKLKPEQPARQIRGKNNVLELHSGFKRIKTAAGFDPTV